MRHIEGTAQSADGLNLYTQAWLPDGEPKAMVAWSHGLGEHSGRYAHVGAALSEAGYGLFMADLRGHGKSPGLRGHLMSWTEFQQDFDTMIDGARGLAPGAPYFVAGHSLGGLIVLSEAITNPEGCHGVFASGASLRLAFEPPAYKIALSKIFSALLPKFRMSNELDPEGLSHDRAVVDAYINDPLVHDRISARFFAEFVGSQEYTMAHAADLALPLLLLQGADDPLVGASGVQDFYAAAGSVDKKLKLYEGLYHEVFNEFEKDEILAYLIGWLDSHL